MDELREVLKAPPILTEVDLPATIVSDIATTYTATHFTMRGSESMGLALRGTRPGHPYADIIFAFAFQKVFQLLVTQLDHSDLRPRVPAAHPEDPLETEGTHLMPLPAFFDDFVLPVTATSPADFVDNKCPV